MIITPKAQMLGTPYEKAPTASKKFMTAASAMPMRVATSGVTRSRVLLSTERTVTASRCVEHWRATSAFPSPPTACAYARRLAPCSRK